MPPRIRLSLCFVLALAANSPPAVDAASGVNAAFSSSARWASSLGAVSSPSNASPRFDSPWTGSSASVDLPHGNPLTDPLFFSAAEGLLFGDAGGVQLNGQSLLDAALIASGLTNSAVLEHDLETFSAARQKLLQALGAPGRAGSAIGKIELIHQVLYRNLLTGGYNPDATDLTATLDTGVYNCASATLLFVALADEVGLRSQALELPGHVHPVIDTPQGRYEVEVTCPTWPDAVKWDGPPREPAGADQAIPETSRGAAATGQREVSPLGLLAMIYYNRGVDAFHAQRFAEAVAANRRALLLDPNNRLAYGNLLAAVNNWALALGAAGDYLPAETLLDEGRQFDPTHLPFVHNADHLRQMQAQAQAAP